MVRANVIREALERQRARSLWQQLGRAPDKPVAESRSPVAGEIEVQGAGRHVKRLVGRGVRHLIDTWCRARSCRDVDCPTG